MAGATRRRQRPGCGGSNPNAVRVGRVSACQGPHRRPLRLWRRRPHLFATRRRPVSGPSPDGGGLPFGRGFARCSAAGRTPTQRANPAAVQVTPARGVDKPVVAGSDTRPAGRPTSLAPCMTTNPLQGASRRITCQRPTKEPATRAGGSERRRPRGELPTNQRVRRRRRTPIQLARLSGLTIRRRRHNSRHHNPTPTTRPNPRHRRRDLPLAAQSLHNSHRPARRRADTGWPSRSRTELPHAVPPHTPRTQGRPKKSGVSQ